MYQIVNFTNSSTSKKLSTQNITFFLCSLAIVSFFLSEPFLYFDSKVSMAFKILGFILLLCSILLRPQIHTSIRFLFPVGVFFLIGTLKSFNLAAALDEIVRFLFPALILIALYSSRHTLRKLCIIFLWIVISNDVYQLYFYAAYIIGLPVFSEPKFDFGYLMRAEGWVGFFSLFGFMNFCAFLLVKHGELFQNKPKYLHWFFIAFSILSTSMKLALAYSIYIMFTSKNKSTMILLSALIITGSLASIYNPGMLQKLTNIVDSKISFYISTGNSARAESYRVMAESISAPNFLGEGLGSFGGPASTTYDSPLYAKYNFNWYGLEELTTTDTFYPHLFVELGLIGGLIYLYFIFNYGQKKKTKIWWVIVSSLLLDSIFSFSLLSPPYFTCAALCMFVFSNKHLLDKRTAQRIQHPII